MTADRPQINGHAVIFELAGRCYQQQQAAATAPDVPLATVYQDNSDSVDKGRLPRINSGKKLLSPFLRHGSTTRLVETVLAVCLHCRSVPVFHMWLPCERGSKLMCAT